MLAGTMNAAGVVTPIPSIILTTKLPHLAQFIGELVEECPDEQPDDNSLRGGGGGKGMACESGNSPHSRPAPQICILLSTHTAHTPSTPIHMHRPPPHLHTAHTPPTPTHHLHCPAQVHVRVLHHQPPLTLSDQHQSLPRRQGGVSPLQGCRVAPDPVVRFRQKLLPRMAQGRGTSAAG